MISFVLFLSAAGSVSAASPQPIRVTLDGTAVPLPNPPRVIGGKTFVEFRPLFAALGYTVEYASSSRSILARSPDRTIEMAAGGKTAEVNGRQVAAEGEMLLVGGRTLVGVRFVAALSGMEVEWRASSRTVAIAAAGPTEEERTAIMDAVKAAADQGTANARLQTQTRYAKMNLIAYSPSRAKVSTSEEIRKVSGEAFFVDQRKNLEYTLAKNGSGRWNVVAVESFGSEVLDAETLWDQAIPVDEGTVEALETAVISQVRAVNGKDFEAFGAAYAPGTPGVDQEIAALGELLASAEVKAALERTAVVELSGDQAILLVQLVTEMTSGGRTERIRTVTDNHLIRSGESWLLTGEGWEEPLFSARL